MQTSRNTSLIKLILLITLFSCGCGKEAEENGEESNRYALCNQMLSDCFNGNGDYCLFGYKWGESNPFSPSGYDIGGPKSPAGIITYSFHELNERINTHSQINMPAKSFDELIACAKPQIRKAFAAWAEVANIEFLELSVNSDSDIRFKVADIQQSGIGYPNYPGGLCSILGGDVIIQAKVKYNDCHSFYIFILHEIGHTLGLGHVQTENIMNPNKIVSGFEGLQAGDILGVKELYGDK